MNTLTVRKSNEEPADASQLLTSQDNVASQITPFAEIIRRRRLELGLLQVDVARRLGVRSSEFIGMLEKGGSVPGGRNLELNKVPRMADALQLSRKDLTRLALFETAPMAAMTLFGDQISLYEVRNSKFKFGTPRETNMTPEQIDVVNKIFALPDSIRATVLSTIDQFAKAYTTPKMGRA